MISANQALKRLRDGNRKFTSGVGRSDLSLKPSHPGAMKGDQEPFAIILSCSDSRVPAEIVFDQGIGDLFVIRVAGNIVGPSQMGSVEFAAARFGTRLVVVLGHSQCGAVLATLEELRRPSESLSPGLSSIIEGVRPAVEKVLKAEDRQGHEALVEKAVRANIQNSVQRLRHDSETLQRLAHTQLLAVVGAEYSLITGEVKFFDEVKPD